MLLEGGAAVAGAAADRKAEGLADRLGEGVAVEPFRRLEQVDGLAGGAGGGEEVDVVAHEQAAVGDTDQGLPRPLLGGESVLAKVGRLAPDAVLKRRPHRVRGAGLEPEQKRAAEVVEAGGGERAKAPGRGGVEPVGRPARPRDQDRAGGRHPRQPFAPSPLQPPGRRVAPAGERCRDVEDVVADRQAVLRLDDDEVEEVEGGLGPSQLDDAGAGTPLAADPGGHPGGTPAGGDDEVGPGRIEGVGAAAVEPAGRGAP